MALMEVGLDDKYRLDAKRIFLSGTQALVRLPIMQRERDRAEGNNTAGFISGYRGSPLGTYDTHYGKRKPFSSSTTSNSLLVSTRTWPQLPCGEASRSHVSRRQGRWRVRHLVRQGARRRPLDGCAQACQLGGHLADWGRDWGGRRRPWRAVLDGRASERAGARRGSIPVVNPATLQDYIDLGLLGFALSRYSSYWVGFKCDFRNR